MDKLFIGSTEPEKAKKLTPEDEREMRLAAKREYDREWRRKRKAEELADPELAEKRKAHRKERDQAWRDKNRDKIKEYNRRYWIKKALKEINGGVEK